MSDYVEESELARRRDAGRRRRKGSPGGDERPVIRFEPSLLHEGIEQGIDVLRADPNLYQREAFLVHLTHVTHDEAEADRARIEGAPEIHRIATDTLRERLTRAAQWEKYDKRSENWVPSSPHDHIVGGIASRKEWTGIRPLVGIIETPFMRSSGTIVDTPGYDRETGYLFAPGIPFPAIPSEPSLEDAQRARAELEDVFADFPYEMDAGRSAVVAAVLTLIARPAIDGAVPAILFAANTPGSGKTLQADVASLIATGRTSSRKNFPTDKRSADEELNKVLGAYAMNGTSLINFDNVGRIPFEGSSLEGVLTAENTAEFRVLGSSRIVRLPWRAMIFGSGNNVIIGRDMMRRVLLVRIESPFEQPGRRPVTDFSHPDRAFRLKPWVRENRARLVAAGLTLLRAFVVAGRPSQPRTWAGFEAWTSLIADAIVWAGGADPVECMPEPDSDENPERASLAVVLRDWPRLDESGHGITVKTALGALYPPERVRGQAVPPDGFEDLREAIEALVSCRDGRAPEARQLGEVFRRYKRSVVGGRMLEMLRADRTGVAKWTVRAAGTSALQPESG